MHPRGHPCRVAVPHRDIRRQVLDAQEVPPHGTGIDQVLGPDRGKGACHLGAVQIALFPHHVLKKGDLAFIQEQQQLARFDEIDLCGHQRDRGQPVIAIARHAGRRDRKHRAAQTIAVGMHLAPRNDRVDRLQRCHDATLAVILKRQVGLIGCRVAPGDAENRETLRDQMADQRILGREVKDVVFHDPGGHDQHRFGMHLIGLRAVLDQLHDVVAKDDLAGCAGQMPAQGIVLGDGAFGLGQRLHHVGGQMRGTFGKVPAMGLDRLLDDLGVQGGKVRGRDRVQHLPHHEARALGALVAQATQVVGGVIPPVLNRKEALLPLAEGRFGPVGMGPARVIGLGAEGGLVRLACQGRRTVLHQPEGVLLGLFDQFQLPPRRAGHVQPPIGPGIGHRMGRDAARDLRHRRHDAAVKILMGMRGPPFMQRRRRRVRHDRRKLQRLCGRELVALGFSGPRPSRFCAVVCHMIPLAKKGS